MTLGPEGLGTSKFRSGTLPNFWSELILIFWQFKVSTLSATSKARKMLVYSPYYGLRREALPWQRLFVSMIKVQTEGGEGAKGPKKDPDFAVSELFVR